MGQPRSPRERCSCSNTNCVERPLTRLFEALGRVVAACPWPFVLLPPLLSAGLGAGFVFLPDLETNDIEGQFTPTGGPAKAERDFVQRYFPTNDSERFSAERLPTEGAYAALIAVAAGDASVLDRPARDEVLLLDGAVRALGYERLCARSGDACASANPLLPLLANGSALPELPFPGGGGDAFLGTALGGVQTDGSGRVERARAMKLMFYLREDGGAAGESRAWLETFLRVFPAKLQELNLTAVEVTYFTSLSRQEEFEGNTKSVIPLFSITYFLTITFSVVSCLRLSCVRNNIWLACCGVLSSGLAVLSSFGLMMYCGVPFVATVANAPFLILGVGVDDMFILISSWEQSSSKADKSDTKSRLAETYREAALSVTITTLTDVLAFFIGTWTSFPSVRSFCLYTGTAFVFCYVYVITFFGAVIVLNHKRVNGNRHWLTCVQVKVGKKSCLYNACCLGSCSSEPPEPETSGTESEHPMSIFFKKYYGPFLTGKWIKLLVVLLYGAYLGGSVYGCTQMKEGIDLRNLASDDSYVIAYYDDDDKYFSEYGPRVMVVVTDSVNYWDESVRNNIEACLQDLESINYVDRNLSLSWLRVYTEIAGSGLINISTKDLFINNLAVLFRFFPSFEWDINETAEGIAASRFFIQTVNVTSAVDEKNLLNQLRDRAKQCVVPLMVYHPAFIYYDQYLVIVQNTIQNVVIAAGAMLVVSLVLIPSPLCCLWVTFAIASVIVGVAGFMTFWDISLDSISMINLVICIGFSVDFSAHISYAFVTSGESSANEKAIGALHQLGYPVLQGAVSTVLGVVVLAAAKTYIFRTFFKIMFLVILFGALHGLVFIPVFLTFFGYLGKSLPITETKTLDLREMTKTMRD
ncbi:patched domain-containing protein 3 isoform X3 [Tympanuchus pallidicinctus]|uniref:patched domain-containing protein 3 isoform X3 n=1 Tax=Tympanuchus pallidicinctus TaxID=109042 RepID=UPI0022873DBB|nr:patched domain-containing protein 3 isoform X3 [Tympanuchus pallidicinctus]